MSCLKMAGHTSVKRDGRVMLHPLKIERERERFTILCACVLSACKQVSHLSQGPKGESKSDVRSVVE